MIKDAVISPCGTYRYRLTRQWALNTSSMNLSNVVWVMMNPSTADAQINDATIRKCIGFCNEWGYSMFHVVNVMAYRSTDPKKLPRDETAVGPDNARWMENTLKRATIIIAAWGRPKFRAHNKYYEIAQSIVHRVSNEHMIEVECLGFNNDRSPKHPLMPAYKTTLQPFPTY